MSGTETIRKARPFLKWAGGKTKLLPDLLARMPRKFEAYHEPFVGSGALFFELASQGRLRDAYLSDINAPLIEAYCAVRDDVEKVIAGLRKHRNTVDYFYEIRGKSPNRMSSPARAARLIYLNKTCFNGLYRENRQGQFNVPFGRYVCPNFCDADNLRAVSAVLARADLSCRPFESVLDKAKRGDFVYFDPPYHPVSTTSSFTSYDRQGFRPEDQEELRQVFKKLAGRGVSVMLSNSDTLLIRELYRDFRIDQVFAARFINSKGDRRGKVPELIVRNYE